MLRAKGIHAHKVFKLGKAPAKRDERNLRLAMIFRALPPLPTEYDFDLKHPGIATPMFANDTYGDCVIAGRAHQSLRFERIEQGAEVTITDQDVLREYKKETGGPDSGLVVLDSLKAWRKVGWRFGKHQYNVAAFAEVTRSDHDEVKAAIYLLTGAGIGLALPKSAQAQIQAGKPWDVVSGPAGRTGSWGGHYVYLSGYTGVGPVCVTWGRKQQMTWAFFDRYADEAYAIVDNIDKWRKGKPGIDVKKLLGFLNALK
jgi:hypothetical protein